MLSTQLSSKAQTPLRSDVTLPQGVQKRVSDALSLVKEGSW